MIDSSAFNAGFRGDPGLQCDPSAVYLKWDSDGISESNPSEALRMFHVCLRCNETSKSCRLACANSWFGTRLVPEGKFIAYAETHLMQAEGEIDSDLVTIASGEDMSEDGLISVVLHFLEAHGQPMSQEVKGEAIEKWRFAHLACLLRRRASDEDKVSALQEIYA